VKWLLRIFGLLAALVVVGLLAWQWMTTEQQQAVKDHVKMLIGKNPRSISGSVPDANTVRSGDGGGLLTGDGPPFAFAGGPWSTVKFDHDSVSIRPNLRFDFELPAEADSTNLSREWAHSGSWSYRMDGSEDYSPAVRRRVGDVSTSLSGVEVGFWMWSSSPKTLLTAVVSIDRGSKQLAWFGKDLPADPAATRGSRLNCNFLMRELDLKPSDIVSVYFWKRGGADAFVDDIDIYFHSAEVLGRSEGKAFALDSIGIGGLAPMGYAAVSLKEVAVENTRFKIGAAAMKTTVDAVHIGGSENQWRFVPQEGVAYLLNAEGTPIAMLRPWSVVSGTDITHFERVVAEPQPHGILLTGFDVDIVNGNEVIASTPSPQAMLLELSPRR